MSWQGWIAYIMYVQASLIVHHMMVTFPFSPTLFFPVWIREVHSGRLPLEEQEFRPIQLRNEAMNDRIRRY